MKRVYLIPNVITAFALTCGLFVIFKTSIADPERAGLFLLLRSSTILVLIAAIADLADGAVARLIKAESEFGGQFDSLSDAVTFGVAPPLLVLKSLEAEVGSFTAISTFTVVCASLIYSLCGVLRLVRYNVQSKKESKGEKRHFTGLPIPAAASGVLSATLILISPLADAYFPLSGHSRAFILSAVLVVLGCLMVSRWKFPSAKSLHFRVAPFYLLLATGISAVLILYGILDYFSELYFIASWLYIILALILSFIRLIAGKRSKTLADFEPDDDDD